MRTACSVVGGMNCGAGEGVLGLREREEATVASMALAVASTGAPEERGTTFGGCGTLGPGAEEDEVVGDLAEGTEEGPGAEDGLAKSSGCESR